AQVDKKVVQEQDEFHRTTKVKWIITRYDKSLLELYSKSLTEMLEKYELVSSYTSIFKSIYLYRRKDSADETNVNPID
ncbi:MAG: hypothetical protein SNH28_07640, partial [Rikenellaceae bacterium]